MSTTDPSTQLPVKKFTGGAKPGEVRNPKGNGKVLTTHKMAAYRRKLQRQICKSLTEKELHKNFQFLIALRDDVTADKRVRLAAVEVMLDRQLGKASVLVELEDKSQGATRAELIAQLKQSLGLFSVTQLPAQTKAEGQAREEVFEAEVTPRPSLPEPRTAPAAAGGPEPTALPIPEAVDRGPEPTEDR